MKKWKCKLCGEIVEAEAAPPSCPLCKQPNAFEEVETELTWASEHHIGLPEDISPELASALRRMCDAECHKAGLAMAMAQTAREEGYPEISAYLQKASAEAATRAGRLMQSLDGALTPSVKKDMETCLEDENASCARLTELAKMARNENLDEWHDLLHEMAREVASHGKAVEGLLERYFD